MSEWLSRVFDWWEGKPGWVREVWGWSGVVVFCVVFYIFRVPLYDVF